MSLGCSAPDEIQFSITVDAPQQAKASEPEGAGAMGLGGAPASQMVNRWTAQTSPRKTSTDQRPNIIVILSDDLGYGEVGFHGAEDFPTPHLVDLADQGVTFTQAYATSSVCSPSRAGLLTGRYQQRFGFEMNLGSPKHAVSVQGLPVSERTLAERLSAVGYQTVAIGKWHLGFAPDLTPRQRGFDHFYGFLGGSRSYFPQKKFDEESSLRLDDEVVEESFDYLTDDLARAAAEYIQSASNTPFFMYLAPTAVHGPLQATEERLAHYPHLAGDRKIRAAMVEALDDMVGTVVGALEARGLRDNTMIVFTDDNGGNVDRMHADNTPLMGGKGSSFEGGNRVPMVWSFPGRLPEALRFEGPVSALDIAATSLALARVIPIEDNLDGFDLLPFLEEGADYPMRSLFLRRGKNWSVRVGDLKLRGRGDDISLHDLDADPGELTDLAPTSPVAIDLLGDVYAEWASEMMEPLW